MTSVVLIHGAWHGAWCWDEVASRLDRAGVENHAVELPLTGHLDDVAAARAALDAVDGPKVVVGHSYGGLVLSGAVDGRHDVSHLIYLCAFMLDRDEGVFDGLADIDPPPLFDALRVAEDGRSTIDPSGATAAFYAESPEPLAAAAIARLRPMDPESTTHPCLGDPWRDVPSTYVICRRDGAIPEEAQRRMATRAADVVILDTDHSPFLSRIQETTDIILAALD